MKIHAGLQQVFRIKREQGVLGRVVTDPEKSGEPLAAVADSGPLYMRARGICCCVESEHSGRERAKAKDPPPSASAQQVLAHQPSEKNKEHNIDQLKAPHRLQSEQVREIGPAGQ